MAGKLERNGRKTRKKWREHEDRQTKSATCNNSTITMFAAATNTKPIPSLPIFYRHTMDSSIQAPSASGTAIGPAAASTLAAAPSPQPHLSSDLIVGDAVKSPSDSDQHKRIEGQLQSLLTSLQEREPLDASYDALLPASFRKHAKACVTISKAGGASSQKSSQSGGGGDGKQQNKKTNILPADVKLHRRLNANLRGIVEKYASTPAGWRRKPNTRRIDVDFGSSNHQPGKGGDATTTTRNNNDEKIESMLRAAFALRESKEHEQRDLVNATLKAENSKLYRSWGFTPEGGAGMGMGGPPMMGVLPPFEEASIRKKRLDGIARQLRDKEKSASERARWTRIAEKGKELVRSFCYEIICRIFRAHLLMCHHVKRYCIPS